MRVLFVFHKGRGRRLCGWFCCFCCCFRCCYSFVVFVVRYVLWTKTKTILWDPFFWFLKLDDLWADNMLATKIAYMKATCALFSIYCMSLQSDKARASESRVDAWCITLRKLIACTSASRLPCQCGMQRTSYMGRRTDDGCVTFFGRYQY